jgi:23S rRNA (guanosine2251-2'-O)-methyltransferase
VQYVAGKTRMIRRVRGYAPTSLALPTGFEDYTGVLAVGAELKNTFCLFTKTQADSKTSIFDTNLNGALALVMGAEDEGLRRLTKETCDSLVSIPMLGTIESLNVSVATGICLYEVVREAESHH